jgi:hypothetical protein
MPKAVESGSVIWKLLNISFGQQTFDAQIITFRSIQGKLRNKLHKLLLKILISKIFIS